jgi:dipeptidyl aminopeptidase/acylaminoacyl peptidase
MNRICFIFLLVGKLAYTQTQPEALSVEKIMQDPKWIGTSPGEVYWSYSGKSVYFTWNPDKATSDSLYQYDLGSHQISKLSPAQTAVGKAIHRGVYNRARSKMAYILSGDLYLLDIASDKTIRITQTEAEERNPGFSNQDRWVTYQSGHNFFAWDEQSGNTVQLTDFIASDSPTTKKQNDQEAWLSAEQMRTSEVLKLRKAKKDQAMQYAQRTKTTDTLVKIYIGEKELANLTISPDARFITYVLYEAPSGAKNTIVPSYITESGFTADLPGRTKVGAPPGKTNFFVFDRTLGKVRKVSTDSIPGIRDQPEFLRDSPKKTSEHKDAVRDVYVNQLSWNDNGSAAAVEILSVDHKDRWIMQLDGESGKLKPCDHQRDEAWIGGPGIGWLSDGTLDWIDRNTIYFQSEQSGYSHLYAYDINTHMRKPITQGNYEVQQVQLSRNKRFFYLVTNEEHPGKQQLYRIRTDGTGKEQITSLTGAYEVIVSPDDQSVAYRYSYQNKPWELFIQELASGKKPMQITDKGMSNEWKAYPWRDTRIFTFLDRDGKPVYARIYEPRANQKNNAAVIFVHGAGYLQNVDYGWSYYYHEFMFNNLLADKGYTVMDLDYRASAGYGRDWRTAIYRHMGGKDLDDEIDAARWLAKEKGIDSARIGIYGGSYGGFMTLMALFTQPSVFKAGAALRPVTDWAHYNDDYTSAILNDPFTDSLAYQQSSPINFAAGLKNHLLICHGMVDENVHFQDAVRLAQRLIELHKTDWELAVYPLEDHGFVEASSWTDEYRRILDLFEKNLK